MRIHLLGFPTTQTTPAYSLCGFTQVTIRFARMLRDLGHTVFLYASEENEAPCDELVTCISKQVQAKFLGNTPYQYGSSESLYEMHQDFNARMSCEIAKRKQPRDLICQIGGTCQQSVSLAHPDLMTVEYSIGYKGSFSAYRVFESSAWQHFIYGKERQELGRYYDTVIPCFFDPSEFSVCEAPEDYFLYVGRLTNNKGISVACDIATKAGVKLKVIGHGDASLITGGHEFLGAVDLKTRNEVLSKARALICPTLYIEPFGCAAVEAQLCGTPVISTDFGGFRETVQQGVSGFRCSYMGEFIQACRQVETLDRRKVWERAVQLYSMENLKWDYQRYFERISHLWAEGWNTLTPPSTQP